MHLSKRLRAMLDISPSCDVMADIGSDHALLPIAYIKEGKARKAIASDISEKSLLKAVRNIKKYEMGGFVELRVGDGLSVLKPFEAGLIVLSGLGGNAVAQILSEGIEKINDHTVLVLSPNQAAAALREMLIASGFDITDEDILQENNKLYPVLLAKKGETEKYSYLEYEFGRQAIQKKHPLLKTLVEKRIVDASAMESTARMSQNQDAKAALCEAERRLLEYRRLLKWL